MVSLSESSILTIGYSLTPYNRLSTCLLKLASLPKFCRLFERLSPGQTMAQSPKSFYAAVKGKPHIRSVCWGVPGIEDTCPGPSSLYGGVASSFIETAQPYKTY